MDKISGLLNASPEKRYKHFISTAADTEKVWMLCNDDGFASVDDEYINLLVFPEQCFAEMFADQDVPTEIDVYDFCERCAEIRGDEKIRFAVFPNGKNATIVSAEDLLNDLKEELSLYE